MPNLVPFLDACSVAVNLEDTKIHLATWNGVEHPIDEFYAGRFNSWQEHQTKRNFECIHVLSLIDLGNQEWLFAGVFEKVTGNEHPKYPGNFLYKLKLLPNQSELIGRVVVHHRRTRQSYVWYSPAKTVLPIIEYRRERLAVADFPGYNSVVISHSTLCTIVQQRIPSWHKPLEHIKGIYLITDLSSGKHYVGKASGSEGIWKRWTEYAANGHGGNKELRKLVQDRGIRHASNFQYSILEIADTHASEADILTRECYWMEALQSRRFGLNGSKRP